jgi:hypothetical protein
MTAVFILGAVQGCFSHDVSINLNPDNVVTIFTAPGKTTGESNNPILLSPSAAGKDYSDNKGKIDKVALESIEFEVSKIYPDNAATQLLSASVTLFNQNPNATHKSQVVTLGAPIAIALGASNTITVFDPSPSDFLLEALKNGDDFTLAISSSIDQAPVHIDVKIHLNMDLTISVL